MTDQSLPKLISSPMPSQTQIMSLTERWSQGKTLRKTAPRKEQAEWKPLADRTDPIDLLEESNIGRMNELVPIRYGRMISNPFAFFRGAAVIMASDLLHTPSTGLTLLANGDCHLLNFGGFATAERNLIFDINDFDEVSVAPWEWDVKRLATSFVIAGRLNGFSKVDCQEVAWLSAQSYRMHMADYTKMPVLQAWHDRIDFEKFIENIADVELKKFYSKKLATATAESAHEKEFAKLAFTAGDIPRIVDQPPLIYHYFDQRDDKYLEIVLKSLEGYLKTLTPAQQLLISRFKLVDVALKVVGIGSVGKFCGIILLMSGNGDPLFLQFKQAQRSILEPYCGSSPYHHAGQRVVIGQRIMQTGSDIFLGWTTNIGGKNRQFYLRQLSDAKIKPVIEIMNAANLKGYAGLCGWALARAHARSTDPAVLTGYMGRSTAFEDSLADFSLAYADQNERDYAELVQAVRTGRIEAYVE